MLGVEKCLKKRGRWHYLQTADFIRELKIFLLSFYYPEHIYIQINCGSRAFLKVSSMPFYESIEDQTGAFVYNTPARSIQPCVIAVTARSTREHSRYLL